jgi:hypothetical protein
MPVNWLFPDVWDLAIYWSESAVDASRDTEQEPWQEAKRKKGQKGQRTSGNNRKTIDNSAAWQEIA